MGIWSDLAAWRGPTPNRTKGGMNRYDGQVTHIAAGFYDGTIGWQLNDSANVSSHFVVGREWGQCAQMVDTADAAWTQGDGNGEWISVENEGFPLGHKLWKPGWHELTAWQIECNARLFARGHQLHGWPLQLTTHPHTRGLGYHGMGAENGYNWGHLHCPGEPIKAQQALILKRAIEIVTGDDMFNEADRGAHGAMFNTAVALHDGGVARQEKSYGNLGEPWLMTAVRELLARPPVQSAPVDAATLKAVLLDSDVLAAIAKAVLAEQVRELTD